MKTDRYMKLVLTIIAGCLIWICLGGIPSASTAWATPNDRGDEVLKVQIVSIDESPTLRWESIPVRIER